MTLLFLIIMLVLSLDAGGTNFVFSAIKDAKQVGEKIRIQSNGDNLDLCLKNIVDGFTTMANQFSEKISAISFVFPGPSDFKNGIIGDLFNLPAFRGGVALGPMLEEIFKVPVFINNDGDLYAYGEALGGTLKYVNEILENSKNPKRYKNLVGLTIGSGFGAGFVHDKVLIKGDNICAGEIWQTSNRVDPNFNSEEGACIEAVKYFYSNYAKIPILDCPEPIDIYKIGKGELDGNIDAAKKSFHKLGRFVGDSIANMVTLFDGIVVIGGGIAGAKDLIVAGINEELNKKFLKQNGQQNDRLVHKMYCLNNADEIEEFVKYKAIKIKVPNSTKEVLYDIEPRSAYMFSNFDTSEMISLGAYFIVENYFNSKN